MGAMAKVAVPNMHLAVPGAQGLKCLHGLYMERNLEEFQYVLLVHANSKLH